jgi:hypothetical protein
MTRSGLILVAQPQELVVRIFAPTGELVRTIGGNGEGPGELRALNSLGILGDTVYVTDPRLRRVSLFTADGDLIETRSLFTGADSAGTGTRYSATVPSLLLADGSAVAVPAPALRSVAAGGGSVSVPVLRLQPDGTQVDTVVMSERETLLHGIVVRGRRSGVRIPFTDAPIYHLLSDRSGVLIVHRRAANSEDESSYRIAKVSFDGDTVMTSIVRYRPLRAEDQVVSSAVAQVRDQMPDRPDLPSADDILAILRREGHVPEFLPPVTMVASGVNGTIWIRREDAGTETSHWQIFSNDGRSIAEVRTGVRQVMKYADEETAIVEELGYFDVPSIVVYRIIR